MPSRCNLSTQAMKAVFFASMFCAIFAISGAGKEDEEMGLEDWIKKGNENNLGACQQKFLELVKKLGYK